MIPLKGLASYFLQLLMEQALVLDRSQAMLKKN